MSSESHGCLPPSVPPVDQHRENRIDSFGLMTEIGRKEVRAAEEGKEEKASACNPLSLSPRDVTHIRVALPPVPAQTSPPVFSPQLMVPMAFE